MKKRTLKTIACAAVMALALSVTACGGSNDDAKTNEETSEATEDAGSEDEVEVEVETETETEDTAGDDSAEMEAEPEADASADDTGAYVTLEDYYNDPAIKSDLDAYFESMSQEGMSLSVEVEGNVLTMTCKFEDSSLITDEAKAQLSDALDASSAVFEAVVASFDEALNQDPGTCTYIVRYTDSDDGVLAEKEFKAQ